MSEKTIKVLVAKPGLDGHNRGAKVVARELRDAGMEVVYMGLHNSPREIIEAAIQEDVDVLGLSVLSGAHMTLVPKILDGLKDHDARDMLVLVGGIIPDDDSSKLKEMGVSGVFGPGTHTGEIIEFIEKKVSKE